MLPMSIAHLADQNDEWREEGVLLSLARLGDYRRHELSHCESILCRNSLRRNISCGRNLCKLMMIENNRSGRGRGTRDVALLKWKSENRNPDLNHHGFLVLAVHMPHGIGDFAD